MIYCLLIFIIKRILITGTKYATPYIVFNAHQKIIIKNNIIYHVDNKLLIIKSKKN